MTIRQKQTFLRDMCYVLRQAAAFRDYGRSGVEDSLIGHPFEPTLHNALLESSLAFLRKANEFFGMKSKASIRVFFPDQPLEWLWANEDRELLNERVMHLSLSEALEGKYDWEDFLNTHLSEAERRFSAFLVRVKSEQPELFGPRQ